MATPGMRMCSSGWEMDGFCRLFMMRISHKGFPCRYFLFVFDSAALICFGKRDGVKRRVGRTRLTGCL